MPFPNAHNYLTVHWTYGTVSETGQFGLRFDPPGGLAPVSQALVDAAAPFVSTFWSTAANLIPTGYKLSFLRLARIDTNGRYVPGTISYDHAYAPVVAGGSAEAAMYPLQVATVCTLRSAAVHGLAHSGRVYIPALSQPLVSNYVWTTAQINNVVNGFSAMLTNLNTVGMGRLSIFSKGNLGTPGGAKQIVTGVQLDTKPDTQRRRAKQLVGSKGLVGNVT
jgi:hypothetical protein